jgi:hypothetical protein
MCFAGAAANGTASSMVIKTHLVILGPLSMEPPAGAGSGPTL